MTTAYSLTSIQAGPGAGGKRPVLFGGGRVAKLGVYRVVMSDSYPSGGEDLSDAFADFAYVEDVFCQSGATALDAKTHFNWDGSRTTPQLQAFKDGTEASTSGVEGYTCTLLIVGY